MQFGICGREHDYNSTNVYNLASKLLLTIPLNVTCFTASSSPLLTVVLPPSPRGAYDNVINGQVSAPHTPLACVKNPVTA